MSGSRTASPGGFVTGTLTRPFGRNPGGFLPPTPPRGAAAAEESAPPGSAGSRRGGSRLLLAAAGVEDKDAWWHKQAEILELQEANKSLLRRVQPLPAGTGSSAGGASAGGGGSFSAAASPLPQSQSSPIWPLPMPLAKLSPGSSAGCGSSGLSSFLPGQDQELQRRVGSGAAAENRRSAHLKLVEDNRRLAEEVATLQGEVLDLRRLAGERDREFREQKEKGISLREQLSAAERRNSELGDEVEKLQKARQMLEELEGGEGSAAQQAVRSYIDQDLAAMRAERHNADALRKRDVEKLEAALETLRSECHEAVSAKELAEQKLEAFRSELDAQRSAAAGAVQAADLAVEENLETARNHISALEHALQDLQQQLVLSLQERDRHGQQLSAQQAAAEHWGRRQQELQAGLDEAEQRAARLAVLEGELQAQEATLAAERTQHQEDIEQQQTAAAEERKKLKREAAKKAAELQAKSSELQQEMEEAKASAKEAERAMHGRLSALRQEKQKVENKLRSQLQGIHAECLVERETAESSQQAAARYQEAASLVATLQSELASQEVESADLQERLLREQNQARQEREVLLKELADASAEHSALGHAGQAKLAEQVAELQEAERAANALRVQLEEERRGAGVLREELEEARADAEGALQQHEALVEALRQEHEAADGQLQTLLMEAADKQRRLGDLQDEGKNIALASELAGLGEGQASPGVATSVSTALWSWAADGCNSPRSLAAATPKGTSSLRFAAVAATAATGSTEGAGDEAVDGVLRALIRERNVKKAKRLNDEFGLLVEHLGADSQQHEDLKERLHHHFQELLLLHDHAIQEAAMDDLQLSAGKEREIELKKQLEKMDERTRVGPVPRQGEALRCAELRCDMLMEEVQSSQIELQQAREGGQSALRASQDATKQELRALGALDEQVREELLSELSQANQALVTGLARASDELAEVKRQAAAELQDVVDSCNRSKASMEAQMADSLTESRDREAEVIEEDRSAFRDELQELRRQLRGELAARADEAAARRRQPEREARLEATLERLKQEREEILSELRVARHAEASLKQDMETLRAEERRERRKEREAHDTERQLLADELQEFQEEHGQLEMKLRLAEDRELPRLRVRLEESEAALLATSQEAQKAVRKVQRGRDLKEQDLEFALEQTKQALARLEGEAADTRQQLEDKLQTMKEQLRKAREDKIQDRHKAERQLEKLRAELASLQQRHEAVEKEKSYMELGGAKQTQEHTAQLQKSRSHSSRLTASLQTTEQRLQELEHTESQLSESHSRHESRCQDLEVSEASFAASARREHDELQQRLRTHEERAQAAETWGQEIARRLQEVEGMHLVEAREEAEAHRRRCQSHAADAGEAKEQASASQLFASRLLRALGREARQLVSFASGQAEDESDGVAELEQARALGEEPEALVSRAFAALGSTLAVLARESAELRANAASSQQSAGGASGARLRRAGGGAVSVAAQEAAAPGVVALPAPATELSSKVAALQRELIKLRERNQELEIERCSFVGAAQGGAPGPPGSGGSSSTSVGVQQKPAAAAESSAQAPKPVASEAPNAVELRQKLKTLQQAKARSDALLEDHKQELARRSSDHRQDLERLQLEMEEQQQRFRDDQEQLQKKNMAAERRARLLEAKLKTEAEIKKGLVADKETVEEQLRQAAKQLEALLAEETKDSDLQRELSALSKQFEQLHGKHRSQLAKAVEQNKLLQREQAHRQKLEEQLARSEQVQATKFQGSPTEKELAQELHQARSEQAQAVQAAQRMEQRYSQVSKELHDEVKRLHEELSQVAAKPPPSPAEETQSPALLQRLRQQEEELRQLRGQLAKSQLASVPELKATQQSSSGGGSGAGSSPPPPPPPAKQPTWDNEEPETVGGGSKSRLHGSSMDTSGLLRDLEQIQETLSAQELALKERKSSMAAPLAQAVPQPKPGGSLEDLERDFGELARSMGFQGNVRQLWEEAQAQAAAAASGAGASAEAGSSSSNRPTGGGQSPPPSRREAPVAVDIPLRAGPGSNETSPSAPRRGVPSSPSRPAAATGTGCAGSSSYPASPGREPALFVESSAGSGSGCDSPSPELPGNDEAPGGTSAESGSAQSQSALLPGAAQEMFQQAEALCHRQRFAEAVPLFSRTLELLEEKGSSPAVAGEVWAHLGVAMQSLDHVPKAIESYRRAVQLDPTLHVCFANLATLHAYLGERERALEYLVRAVELDPKNPTYAQLRRQFEAAEDDGSEDGQALSSGSTSAVGEEQAASAGSREDGGGKREG
eukprot:TRINITY_DN8139_c1_g2_i1.p1 TRINITY_DN8139_c1_g2~~TRINITY_DN8139_c1_g2_i1.p1  ORF type:complete len:2278 (+),score=713.30 TRINITY_DN8139_c1_g2_i1:130-6963(+)